MWNSNTADKGYRVDDQLVLLPYWNQEYDGTFDSSYFCNNNFIVLYKIKKIIELGEGG